MIRRWLPASWRARILSAEQFDWREAADAVVGSPYALALAMTVVALFAVVLNWQ